MKPRIIKAALCDRHFADFALDPSGVIHSVFSKAVNIWNGRDLYAVIADPVYGAPYTANVRGGLGEFAHLEPGSQVFSAGNGCIHLSPGLVLDCREAPLFVPPPPPERVDAHLLGGGINLMDACLLEGPPLKGCLCFYARRYLGLPWEGGLLQREIFARLEALTDALAAGQGYAACAARLVGMGEGLTPSGDDFLCGLLVALHRLGRERAWPVLEQIRGELSAQRLSTTPVSRQMLKACLEERSASRLYLDLADALGCNDRRLPELLRQSQGIGHTSGADFSAGLAVGVRWILDQ